jgi:small subunit ribosomal protein S13
LHESSSQAAARLNGTFFGGDRDQTEIAIRQRLYPKGLRQMPRILGVDIPNDKPVFISLTYLYGMGEHQAIGVCSRLNIDPRKRAHALTEDEVSQLNTVLDKEYTIEGQLRRSVQQDIARLRDIHSYRGLRHRRNLPVRGQRTKTNARTRKGVKKTVAGKKGVKDARH